MRRLSRKLGEPRRLGMEGDREPDCDDPEPLPEEELPELLFVEQLVREECDPDLELCDPLRLLDELYRLRRGIRFSISLHLETCSAKYLRSRLAAGVMSMMAGAGAPLAATTTLATAAPTGRTLRRRHGGRGYLGDDSIHQ